MRIAVTGSEGFLGRHIRLAAEAMGSDVIACRRPELASAVRFSECARGARRVIHCAGVNRGEPMAVIAQNIELARVVSRGLHEDCETVVFANSVLAGDGSAYGTGKAAAADILGEACAAKGVAFVDVRLPHLYGEGGRPHYNSVTATFVANAVQGQPLTIVRDQLLRLVHVSDAVDSLVHPERAEGVCQAGVEITIEEMRQLILQQLDQYSSGYIPALKGDFDRHIFNMIRDGFSVTPTFIQPQVHSDVRGRLYEGIRHLGSGQVFFSDTRPMARRGDHYHTRKFERFIVLQGTAALTCRDLLGRRGQATTILSAGSQQSVADMHTYETHTVQNVGAADLMMAFWISEHFDPDQPDTISDWLELSDAPA